MKVIQARTLFVLAALILILLTVVGAVLGFLLVGSLYPHSGNWPLAGLIIGLLVGILAGTLLSLQFVGYFRAKIWPSETKTARKQGAFATNRSRRLDLEATAMSADNITGSKEKDSSPQPPRLNVLLSAIVASFIIFLIVGIRVEMKYAYTRENIRILVIEFRIKKVEFHT